MLRIKFSSRDSAHRPRAAAIRVRILRASVAARMRERTRIDAWTIVRGRNAAVERRIGSHHRLPPDKATGPEPTKETPHDYFKA